jgi:hypothetical protein
MLSSTFEVAHIGLAVVFDALRRISDHSYMLSIGWMYRVVVFALQGGFSSFESHVAKR